MSSIMHTTVIHKDLPTPTNLPDVTSITYTKGLPGNDIVIIAAGATLPFNSDNTAALVSFFTPI